MNCHLKRVLIGTLIMLGLASAQLVVAQTITIRMLHGKSGKPLSNKNVTMVWSPDFVSWHGTEVHLGKDGTGAFEVPPGKEIAEISPGPKVGKEPNRIPYIDCNAPLFPRIQISAVLKEGFVACNTCSKKTAAARPGEIVLWAMPLPWWQPDMQ